MPLHCLSLGFHWNSTASRHNRGAALLDRRPATMSSLVAFLLLEDWCVCVSWSTVCVILVCLSAIIWLKCGQLMCRGPGGLTQLHARFAVSRSILTASPPQTPHKPQTWWGTIHTFGTPRLICMMLSVSGGLKGHTSLYGPRIKCNFRWILTLSKLQYKNRTTPRSSSSSSRSSLNASQALCMFSPPMNSMAESRSGNFLWKGLYVQRGGSTCGLTTFQDL